MFEIGIDIFSLSAKAVAVSFHNYNTEYIGSGQNRRSGQVGEINISWRLCFHFVFIPWSGTTESRILCCCCCQVASVVSDSVRPHKRQHTRLPHPWDSPGKNTGLGCHFLLQCMRVKSESEVVQSCPTLHDRRDCSLPGSSVHRIFQARVLEWVTIAFSHH